MGVGKIWISKLAKGLKTLLGAVEISYKRKETSISPNRSLDSGNKISKEESSWIDWSIEWWPGNLLWHWQTKTQNLRA